MKKTATLLLILPFFALKAENIFDKMDDKDAVSTGIYKLSDDEKELVLLRYQQELPMKDIADIVDKEETTVRVTIHRALAKLKKRYSSIYACIVLVIVTILFSLPLFPL